MTMEKIERLTELNERLAKLINWLKVFNGTTYADITRQNEIRKEIERVTAEIDLIVHLNV